MLNFVHFICFPNTIIENHVLQKKHLNESKIFPAIPLSCSLLGFEKTEINADWILRKLIISKIIKLKYANANLFLKESYFVNTFF